MPILEIEIVIRSGETLPTGVASAIAERAGEIFASAPGGTWVRLRALPDANYAENGGGPPDGVQPVFVSVLKSSTPEPGEMAVEISRLTEAVADVCGRPAENVHILYLPEGAGRVAFGGRLVKKPE